MDTYEKNEENPRNTMEIQANPQKTDETPLGRKTAGKPKETHGKPKEKLGETTGNPRNNHRNPTKAKENPKP